MADLRMKMRHPDGGGAGYRGVSYEPDKKGEITVPWDAAEELMHHGFVPTSQVEDEAAEPDPKAEVETEG